MTVHELIRALSAYPADMEVLVNLHKNELANGRPVAGVEMVTCYRNECGNWCESYLPDGEPAGPREVKLNVHA